MELKDEYKELRILFDGTLENLILKQLDDSNIIKFTIIPKLKVSWQKKIKHLNTHTWPGEDELLIVISKKKECYDMIDKFITLKNSLDYSITFDISVRAIEYLNIDGSHLNDGN